MRDETMPKQGWEFNKDVADVFPDMLRRSIPNYEWMRDSTSRIIDATVGQRNLDVLDLGCSDGQEYEKLVRLSFEKQLGKLNEAMQWDFVQRCFNFSIALKKNNFNYKILRKNKINIKKYYLLFSFNKKKILFFKEFIKSKCKNIEDDTIIFLDPPYYLEEKSNLYG
mgnify:CR=1 FL=1